MAAFNFGRSSFGKTKYKSQRTAGGYGSKLESAVNDMLLQRERNFEIKNIKRQQTIVLQGGPLTVRITIRIDFTADDVKTSDTFAIEAKGFSTRDWKLKLKLWRAKPPMALEIWGGDYRRIKLIEKIEKDTPGQE